MAFDFEHLVVYQKSLALIDEVYRLTHTFPSEERFGLTDQLRRAAISIALNIAEGSGRTKRDFCHFLRTSRSSCYECAAVLQIAERQAYLSAAVRQRCAQQVVDVSKMLSGLMRSLGKPTSMNHEQRTMNT